MATETLTPYKNNTQTLSFLLQSSSSTKTTWLLSGRPIALPHTVSVERKPSASNAATNDHVIVRVSQMEQNPATGKLATLQVTLDISIPKDQSVIGIQSQREALAVISSILNENTAMEATYANITKLIEGRDL